MRSLSRWFVVVLFVSIWWVAWGCPAVPVTTGDGGESGLSDSSKSDGVSGDAPPEASSPPEARSEAVAEGQPEARTEPTAEPVNEPVAEPKSEVTPEPTGEPVNEPVAEASPDAGAEMTPETSGEMVAETVAELPGEQVAESVPSTAKVGDPCGIDAHCGGSPMICIPEGQAAGFPFPSSTGNGPPGGYCTIRCMIGGTQCPQGSECYVPGAASGVCLKTCTADTDCRDTEGYKCASDGGTQNNACFPPTCSLTQPGGDYWMTISTSTAMGNCTQSPLSSGSRLPVTIKITAGEITFTFGSKPQSSLPVTRPLVGTYSATSQFTAANPKGCTQSCDGTLATQISNPCLFYGTLSSKVDTSCTHVYDASFTKQ